MRCVGKEILLLLLLKVLNVYSGIILKTQNENETVEFPLLKRGESNVKTCNRDDDCEYPLTCDGFNNWPGKCVLKSCLKDHDCEYPLMCDGVNDLPGKCVLKTCNNLDDCDYHLMCDGVDGAAGKCIPCDCGSDGTCSFDDDGKQVCTCYPGFSLDKTKKCAACYCGTDGSCSLDDDDKQVCTCNPGFSLDKTKKCAACDCGTGGTCSFEDDNPVCTCKPGFLLHKGKCEDPCTYNPCKNGGTCQVDQNNYTCSCPEPFSGNNCEEDPCTDSPCENGGTCQIDKNTYKCSCPQPFSGNNCEKEDEQTDPCERNPCQNDGTCEPVGDTNYTCNCLTGVSGENCEKIDWCENNKEICGRAPCKYDKKLESGICFCDEGFYFDAVKTKCQKLDKCLLQRIKGKCRGKHETCDNEGKCKCEDNYAYNKEKTACEPDFCGEKSKKRSPCGANMDCSIKDETFSCSCKDGYRQNGRQCVKVDKCAPGVSQCQQICTNGKCSCFPGFKPNDDNYTCERKEETSECTLNCGPGTCVNEGNTPKCICPQISHILKNGTCIDKCTAGSIPASECPSEVGCLSDDATGYKCNCTGKYGFADDDIHCRAKQMCSEGDGNEICSKKNQLCEDDFASPEGYKCNCKFGYEKVKNTGECRHKCETAGCDKKQALCFITDQNKAECICPPLLVKNSDGKCNELAKYSYLGDFSVPRNNYQLITNKNSGRMKRDTSADINYSKLLKDFETSMKHIFTTYEDASILRCIDEDDDLSCSLEIKLKEDPKEKINIVSTPSVCLSLDESHCLIQPDFVIKKRTDEVFHKTDPCDKIVNGKMCGNETKCEPFKSRGFKCECKQGYFRRNYYVPAPDVVIEVCEDVNECLKPDICPNTTTCSNFPGDYTCKCIDGYRLEEGSSVKDDGCRAVCDPNPCKHGKCNVTGTDGFSCSCDDFYTGHYCNQTSDVISEKIKKAKQEGKKISAIVGGVLGAFLVMAIIICIILFRKLRKQKSTDETEEYVRQRKRGLVSEMRKLGRRQPENEDVELRDNERRPNRENEDQRYNVQHRINPIDSMSIPRPQLGRSAGKGSRDGEDVQDRRESGDYRRGYSGDDRMFPKAHSSRPDYEEARRPNHRDDDRQERPRRPLSRSSDPLDNEKIGVSRMQYRNRGYEED